jgi:hypothetical protein
MELKNIILSEVSQTQKAKSHVLSLICEKQTIQSQQYYETLVTLKGGHTWEG